MPSLVTSGGVFMIAKHASSAVSPMTATSAPTRSAKTNASPAVLAASWRWPAPYRRAATAVRPMLTISATETTSQIQNTEVDTAASPSAPTRVPTQYVSIDVNTVMSTVDAIAGSATRTIVRGSESPTSCAAGYSAVAATGASPSRGSNGSAAAGVGSPGGRGPRSCRAGALMPRSHRCPLHRLGDTFSECAQRLSGRRAGIDDDDRTALVARLKHTWVQRDLREQRQ